MEREYKMINDVVPNTAPRTIRKVPINKRQVEERKTVEEYTPSQKTYSYKNNNTNSSGKSAWSKIFIAIIILVVLAGGVFFASSFFAKGTITLKLKKATVDIATTVTPNFHIYIAKDSTSEVVPATPGKVVQTKASGVITIYNGYSKDPQPLVALTRFESSSGNIYRIQKPVTIPGWISAEVPSKVDVTVYADKAGVESNIPLSETVEIFTIPGFKGSKKYEGFYAEQKTAITGGFSGTKNNIDPKVEKEAKDRLTASLNDLIRNKLHTQIAPDEVLYENLIVISVEESPSESKGTNQSVIELKATGSAFALKKDDFVNQITEEEKKKLGITKAHSESISNLSVSPVSPVTLSSKQSFPVKVQGRIDIVGAIDIDTLKSQVLGIHKNDLTEIFKKFDSISSANVTFYPFWQKNLPKKAKNIEVILD